MIKIKFNSPEEFMEELEKNNPEDGIVRLTFMAKGSGISPNIKTQYIVGTAVTNRGYIARLDVFCGETWPDGAPGNDKVTDRASSIMQTLKDKAADLQLDVRAGVFEE
jgi:hypothetical protein